MGGLRTAPEAGFGKLVVDLGHQPVESGPVLRLGSGDEHVLGVRGAELEVGLPKTLAPAGDFRALVQGPDYSDYAVTANGQRFLVRRPADPNARQRLHVMLDWPSLVK